MQNIILFLVSFKATFKLSLCHSDGIQAEVINSGISMADVVANAPSSTHVSLTGEMTLLHRLIKNTNTVAVKVLRTLWN